MGGGHLLPCVLTCLKAKGRAVLAELDERYSYYFSTNFQFVIYLKF
jgi:hypothetical protein